MIRKTTYFVLVFLLTSMLSVSAQVTIGGQTDPQAFSVLELISEGKRGLRLPQLTTAEKEALTASNEFESKKTTDARGLMIFNRDTKCVEVWSGEKWISRCEEDQYVCDTPEAPGEIMLAGTSESLNLNKTFALKVTAVEGMTYTWTVPYGMEITANSNNQITVKVVKAGSYPLSLISVTATNDCGNTSAATIGNNSTTIDVNNCADAPTLTSSTIIDNTIVNGAKSGSGTEADPYTLYIGQTISLTYIGGIAGETYTWSLNSNGTNHFSVETNNGTFLQLRARDIVSTAAGNAIGLIASNECGDTERVSSSIYVKIETVSYPTITGVVSGNNCGEGTVILSATASNGAMVRWYDVASGGTALETGNTFVTPSLATSAIYYVDAYNAVESTTSLNRTAVTVTINEAPTVEKVQDASRAGAGTISLAGCATTSTSGASVRYFSEATGGDALNNSTTGTLAVGTHTFYAEAYTATCTSERVGITVRVTPGTGLVINPDPTGTLLPAGGTEAARTSELYTASNLDCLTSGSYSFVVTAGDTYASIVSSNASAGTFKVKFEENTSTAGRAAVVRVTDPCNNTKTFVITQDGVATVNVSSISVSGSSSVNVGSTISLSASVSPSSATNKDVTWSVYSGSAYASVSASGVVTGKAAGSAEIRATAADGSGVYGSKTVTVKEATPEGFGFILKNGVYEKTYSGSYFTQLAGGSSATASAISNYFTATSKTLYIQDEDITVTGGLTWGPAVTACSLAGGRLPNLYELVQLQKQGTYGLGTGDYWSSTEQSGEAAWIWIYNYMATYRNKTINDLNVRCVKND